MEFEVCLNGQWKSLKADISHVGGNQYLVALAFIHADKMSFEMFDGQSCRLDGHLGDMEGVRCQSNQNGRVILTRVELRD